MSNNNDTTRKIDITGKNEEDVRQTMVRVYQALEEKGYNPFSQIVGYILSEDPTYITTHNNARSLVRRINRFELLQIMLDDFMKNSTGETD